MPGPEVHTRSLILIVEDEALVRMTLVDVLEDAGFKVVEAVHADEALRVLSAVSGIHAVVTDVERPREHQRLRVGATRSSQPAGHWGPDCLRTGRAQARRPTGGGFVHRQAGSSRDARAAAQDAPPVGSGMRGLETGAPAREGGTLGPRTAGSTPARQWQPGSNQRPRETQTWRPVLRASRRAGPLSAHDDAEVASHMNASF
jgi:CheY-like chemotaxis protein